MNLPGVNLLRQPIEDSECWAHGSGCDWLDCPATNSIVGHGCREKATTDIGLCTAHHREIVGGQ